MRSRKRESRGTVFFQKNVFSQSRLWVKRTSQYQAAPLIWLSSTARWRVDNACYWWVCGRLIEIKDGMTHFPPSRLVLQQPGQKSGKKKKKRITTRCGACPIPPARMQAIWNVEGGRVSCLQWRKAKKYREKKKKGAQVRPTTWLIHLGFFCVSISIFPSLSLLLFFYITCDLPVFRLATHFRRESFFFSFSYHETSPLWSAPKSARAAAASTRKTEKPEQNSNTNYVNLWRTG